MFEVCHCASHISVSFNLSVLKYLQILVVSRISKLSGKETPLFYCQISTIAEISSLVSLEFLHGRLIKAPRLASLGLVCFC